MFTAFRLIKMVFILLVFAPLMWAASCSLLGVGASYAIKEAAGPISEKMRHEAKLAEIRRHNERLNREAGYASHSDAGYTSHYDEDYDY